MKPTTLNCRGKLLDLSKPVVMGILNVTPDSFYDGGRHHTIELCLLHCEHMLAEGAAIIDVGGISTRPGADMLSEATELSRVLPVIEAIVARWPEAIVSIDTFRASVARRCVEAGASIINDVSGGQLDDDMFQTVADLGVPYVLMHARGNSKTMQQLTEYQDIAIEVLDYFLERVLALRKLGVKDIIIDPGFGFAKNIAQNYYLLKMSHIFEAVNTPLLIGLSRKSMIYNHLGIHKEDSLNGTTILNTIALQQGAAILRVHDVKEAVQVIQLLGML